MRILVSGGAGFIGSHLVEKLIDEGHIVSVIDDLSNGSLKNLSHLLMTKKINIQSSGFFDSGRLKFWKVDISNQSMIYWYDFPGMDFDLIYHLACFPRSMSFANPYLDAQVNALGMINILQIAKECRAKVIFSSNSGIYDALAQFPITEDSLDNPKTPYDLHKQLAEKYMRMWAEKYGFKIVSFRLSTVYGDRQTFSQDWKPVIRLFIDQLMHNQRPMIYWDGNQTRDFIFVDDIVSALFKAKDIESPYPTILGTGIETSINEVYKLVSEELGCPNIEPVRGPKQYGDIERMCYPSTKARNLLSWEPKVNLEEGIKRTIAYYREAEERNECSAK